MGSCAMTCGTGIISLPKGMEEVNGNTKCSAEPLPHCDLVSPIFVASIVASVDESRNHTGSTSCRQKHLCTPAHAECSQDESFKDKYKLVDALCSLSFKPDPFKREYGERRRTTLLMM